MSSPTRTHAYGEPSYWDQRYREDPGPFDWYQKYKTLAPLFDLYVRRSHRVLLVGCGNSTLGEELVSDGYLDVVNIDISSVVIEAMQQKYDSKPELKYIKMDVRDMSSFESSSFDAVIDKGTLDSLMCGQNAHHNTSKMLEEIGRILKDNGVYILITYGEPSYRLHLLKELQLWTIQIHVIDRMEKSPEQRTWELTKPLPLSKDGNSVAAVIGSNAEVHYIYVCIKDQTLRRQSDDQTLRRQSDDHVRTETYRNAILRHQNLISGKVVMDVGCGTGILSIFCALAGARRVYAIEASDIAVQASEVVKANNLSDKVIVIHEKVEKVSIEEKVDVIISEWMGYMLLYESMLSSVIFARDNWLKQGGLILPSHATLYMAPITHSERYSESIDFWRDVYGIDMSVMLPLAKQCAFEEPSIETISAENVLTWPFIVKSVDCYTITARELESITTKYNFTSMLRAPLHGFAFWFDAEFNGPPSFPPNNSLLPGSSTSDLYSTVYNNQMRKRAKSDQVLVLSTAPEDEPTHWQQTILYLYEPIEVIQDQTIEGSITISQSLENRRFLNIHLEYISGGRSFVKESIMR